MPNPPIDIFLYVNREVRKANRAKMAELAKQTSPTHSLAGKLHAPARKRLPLPNLLITADYYYEGKKIDEAFHPGL